MIPSPLPSPGPDRLPDGYRVAGPGQKEGPWQNRLALAHSPYLRQHASNPVDWYPWGPAAWAAAAARQRPIFLSVGYAAWSPCSSASCSNTNTSPTKSPQRIWRTERSRQPQANAVTALRSPE